MKRKFAQLIVFLILTIVMVSGQTYAANTPPVGYEFLTDEQKLEADKLLMEFSEGFVNYQKVIIKKAEAICKGYLTQDSCNNNLYFNRDKATREAGKSDEAKTIHKNLKSISDRLFKEYGVLIKVHYQDGGAWSDVCDETKYYRVGNQSQCEGPLMAGIYSEWKYNWETDKFTSTPTYALDISYPTGPDPYADAVDITIASEGLFTNSQVKSYGKCDIAKVKKQFTDGDNQIGPPKLNSQNVADVPDMNDKSQSPIKFTVDLAKDKIGGGLNTLFKNATNDLYGTVFGTDCDNNSLSVVSQFLNVSRPLNLTDNQYIMKLVHITQQVAFTLTVVMIAFYAIMYTTGFQNLDPVKFAIRLFFCLLAVSYLPWLMQDILNLNNILVYNLSTITFDFGVEGNSTDILMGAFTAVFESLIDGVKPVETFLFLLFIIIVAILAITPMLRIIMWWYVRLLKIFLAAIVGPLLVMFAALPQTAERATKWMSKFVAQVFEQVFMALGLIMVAVILGNLGDFGSIIGVGWFGKALLVYAAIYFLADVPQFADAFIGSGFAGAKGLDKSLASDAKKVGRQGKKVGGKAVAGAAVAGGVAVAGGLATAGLAAGAKRAITGKGNSGMMNKILSKSKAAQAGSKAGFRGAGAVKNMKTGFDLGNKTGDRNAGGGAGKAGTLGSHAGAAVEKASAGIGKLEKGVSKAASKVSAKLSEAKANIGAKVMATQAKFLNPSKTSSTKSSVSNSAKNRGTQGSAKNGAKYQSRRTKPGNNNKK